jgi:ElaB/YqjD/DUF883 family membrane-anchored ribosome-binding protein
METNPKAVDKTQETAAQSDGPGKSSGFENVKNRIADKLHHIAQVIGKKAADPNAQPDVAVYEKQASEWLDHSSRYVRQFDYKQADAKARQYVRQNPGRSILIAGAVGLMIGAVLRRRQG